MLVCPWLPADFPLQSQVTVSIVCTPLLCHNKQLLCSFNFKSSCSSRFGLEKKRLLEVLGKLGRQRFLYGDPQVDHLRPGFFHSSLTSFLLGSPQELRILHVCLYRADQAPLSSAVERREVVGAKPLGWKGGWVC